MTEADVEIILQRGLEKYPRQSSNHLRQRTAVHCSRFQRVHPHRRSDPRTHLALLSAEQREDRALAQVAQSWLHPPWSPQDARRLVSGFVEHYQGSPHDVAISIMR